MLRPGGLLPLASGSLELLRASATGGSIARLDYVTESGFVPVMRGAEGKLGFPLEPASFPLVPYGNRIRNGRFSFRGREATISGNLEVDANSLHGQGWLSRWQRWCWRRGSR